MTTTPAASGADNQPISDESLLDVLDETSGYLDVVEDSYDHGDPVPLDRFVDQAIASGYDRPAVEASLRKTTVLVAADGDVDGFRLVAADSTSDESEDDTTANEDGQERTGAYTLDALPDFETELPDDDREKILAANPWLDGVIPADLGVLESLARKVLPERVEFSERGFPILDSDETFYPAGLKQRDIWILWALIDGAKQPVDPSRGGRPQLWRFGDDNISRPEVSFEEAHSWDTASQDLVDAANARPKKRVETLDGERLTDEEIDGLYEAGRGDELETEYVEAAKRPRSGIILQDRTDSAQKRITLVDWDDVRDPETGETHPYCAICLFLIGGYAEISQSGAGVHQFVYAALPEGMGLHIGDFDIEFTPSQGRRSLHDEPPAFDGDKPGDLATVEVYDGKRVVGLTGNHVTGTGDDLVYAQDAIDTILNDTGAFKSYQKTTDDGDTTRTYELAKGHYQGDGIETLDVEASLVPYAATVEARRGGWTNVPNWRLIGWAAALGLAEGLTADQILNDLPHDKRNRGEVSKVRRKFENGNFHPPSLKTLADAGVLPENHGLGSTFIPDDADSSRFVETCCPPDVDAGPVDIDHERAQIQSVLYTVAKNSDDLCVDVHPAGTGKTTSYALAAANRDDRHVVLLPTHENCREFQLDESKPDGYLHLKGAGQPRDDACMDAQVDDETCPTHGNDSCPTMCPAYTHLEGEDLALFKALSAAVGVIRAHQMMSLDEYPWHGDECDWQAQFDGLSSTDRVVTVHNYATLPSVRKNRLTIIDDLQGNFETQTHLTPSMIGSLKTRFETMAETSGTLHGVFGTLADFCGRLGDATTGGEPDTDALSRLEAPTFELPTGAHRVNIAGRDMDTTETLSRVARAYYDATARRVQTGEWGGEPFDLTPLFAALAETGVDSFACRVAMRQPFVLTECLRDPSHGRLQPREGRLICPECGWDETQSPRAAAGMFGAPKRAVASVACGDGDAANGIVCRHIPPVVDLPNPDETLVLDATPRVEVLKLLFGTDSVQLLGNREYSLPNTHVTQTIDGAYHRSTITSDETTTADRIQTALDKIAAVHDRVLVVAMRTALTEFDIPGNCETRYYGALRGLNHTECDAVVCIGAPHPPEDDIHTTARLLAQDTDARVGGTEYSVRRDNPHPPVYTKYRYTDDDGNGRAIATKAYAGVMGELFAGAREDELEQAVHRIRPVLTDDDSEDHIYLLTNVATSVPVDTLTTLNAIDDPLQAALGVGESAAEFLNAVAGNVENLATFEGTRQDWVDAAEDVEASKRSCRRWLKQLCDAGHVEKAGYASNGAMLYQATKAAAAAFGELPRLVRNR